MSNTAPGMAAMVAHARQLARNAAAPNDDETLLSAASDLVAWGAFSDAETLLQRLEEQGKYAKDIKRLRRSIQHFSHYGPEYEPSFLANALEVVHRPNVGNDDLLKAATSLLRWGALDEADLAIGRMEQIERLRRSAASMRAASRQLRRSGLLSTFSAVGSSDVGSLNRPHEAVLAKSSVPSETIAICFTGTDRTFWLSLHVLYHFLRKFNLHVLYLQDHSSQMFLNGLSSISPGYPQLIEMLKRTISEVEAKKAFVMGFSAGGFVGLRAAADLDAFSYLGLGIQTDLSLATELPISKYVNWAREQCSSPELLVDLRDYLRGRSSPHSIQLYSGDGARFDVAHAENLRGLPNVSLRYLPDYRSHNVMPGLIARGQLPEVLNSFFASGDGA